MGAAGRTVRSAPPAPGPATWLERLEPRERPELPRGRLGLPGERLVLPEARPVLPPGRLVLPGERLEFPQARLVLPRGRLVLPRAQAQARPLRGAEGRSFP